MARLVRLYAPETCHLVQAHLLPYILKHMQAVRPRLLEWLEQAAARYQLATHAWSLTDSEIFLLCTPQNERSVSCVMQALGRNLAAHLQQGAVFNGRFRSCLVEPGEHILASMVWMEMHVHHVQGIQEPERLPWTSAGWHTGEQLREIPWLQDHMDYWHLGNTPFERQARYRELCQEGLSATMIERIEQTLRGQWVLGHADFLQAIAQVASRRVTPGRRGRPRKETQQS